MALPSIGLPMWPGGVRSVIACVGHLSADRGTGAAHPVHSVTQELHCTANVQSSAWTIFRTAEVATISRSGLPDRGSRRGWPGCSTNAPMAIPLFLATLVEALVRQGCCGMGRPAGSWWGLAALGGGCAGESAAVHSRHLEQLPPEEQTLLEAASVAGGEFRSPRWRRHWSGPWRTWRPGVLPLARRGQFVRTCGTDIWADGAVATRYGFTHDVYREPSTSRCRSGDVRGGIFQIGLRLEVGYGTRGREVAAELAEHFVRGRDATRAVQYLQYAGEQAVQRSAYQEAIAYLSEGLELLTLCRTRPSARSRNCVCT